MHAALRELDHRPWPIPAGPWTWRQSWRDLLFAHWPVAADRLRRHVPAELELEEFDGTAWIGVVPFRMTGVMRRHLPDVPGLSAFPELNVRTYVSFQGRPGVWFFSLDAANRPAVWAARALFHLPYYYANMAARLDADGDLRYHSSRRKTTTPVNFAGRYGPIGAVYRSDRGSLEHWLTERYCLYARNGRGRLYRAEVHHAQWPLQPARLDLDTNTMTQPLGIELKDPPTLLHFSRRIDVVVWNPTAVC